MESLNLSNRCLSLSLRIKTEAQSITSTARLCNDMIIPNETTLLKVSNSWMTRLQKSGILTIICFLSVSQRPGRFVGVVSEVTAWWDGRPAGRRGTQRWSCSLSRSSKRENRESERNYQKQPKCRKYIGHWKYIFRNFDDQLSSNFHMFVEIHQVRRLVFDNYQRCPVS